MKPRQSSRVRLAPALAALALAWAIASPVAAVDAAATNGAAIWPASGASPHGSLGSIAATPDGCRIAFTITIVTDPGGGTDSFELQVADDGLVIQTIPLSAPADGNSHEVTGSFWLAMSPGNATPGIGLYLLDDGNVLDILDPLPVGCSPLEVPAVGSRGFATLGMLLAASALVVLRRTRTRSV